MAAERLTSESNPDLTVEQRVDLILDLTRRLGLLENLLKTARARRGWNEGGVGKTAGDVGIEQSEGNVTIQYVVVHSWIN